jgi:predicted dehydrogenase
MKERIKMKLGVIGYGLRSRVMIDEFKRVDPDVGVTAINDIRMRELKAELGEEGSCITFYEDLDEMHDQEKLDGIIIGTRCSLHTEMALKVLPKNIPLLLEKPVSINHDQILALKKGYEENPSEVVVSFPLRYTPVVQLAKEIIDSGKIGTVEHIQAVNNVPYGAMFFQNWFRDETQTGGLFLQKATHDFDYINYLAGQSPSAITAMKSKQVLKGNKPAGLKCVDCDEQDTCPESAVRKRKNNEIVNGEYCCFAVDTGNEDTGSAIIQYHNGMHAVYSQNFFARKHAQARGARLLGYKGTLEFDFYTGILKVYMHHTDRVERYQIDVREKHHFGGDESLVKNFIGVMKGQEKSKTPLEEGLLSALMCYRADQSATTHTFQAIQY